MMTLLCFYLRCATLRKKLAKIKKNNFKSKKKLYDSESNMESKFKNECSKQLCFKLFSFIFNTLLF